MRPRLAVAIPADLLSAAREAARREGITLGAWVRRAIARALRIRYTDRGRGRPPTPRPTGS